MPDDLIKEIREAFAYDKSRWDKVRTEAQKDMRCVAGDPWDPKERKQREDLKRPCLSLDEINQYTNQLINNVRQNKRAIKVDPKGNGANDKTAYVRQGIIRGVEYDSSAQGAYITAFENAVNRSYGYWRLSVDWNGDESFDRKLVIKQVQNPDSVWIDPDTKLPDRSDMKHAFVLDTMPRDKFEKEHPNAQVTDFSLEDQGQLKDWISERMVQLGEYWKVKDTYKKLLLVKPKRRNRLLSYIPFANQADPHPYPVFEDEYSSSMGEVIDDRKVTIPKPVKYKTNGVEIFSEEEWPGRCIPIISVFGKELWVDTGSGPERVLMSLVRLARDPLMLYCYYRTCEAEVVGITPKTPYIGYEGQFEGHEDEWQKVNISPIPYLQVKPVIDATGGQVLPLPARQKYEPAIQQLEVGAEAARRAIQAAMGITPLPTAAQRQNEKSGVALEKIQSQQAVGTFHFVDNLDLAMQNCGRQMDELIPLVYDTPREVGIRNDDESYEVLPINQPTKDEAGNPVVHDPTVGEHGVTVSTGPSYDSQRERSDEFLGELMKLPVIGQNPMYASRVLAKIVRSMDLGVVGDQIGDMLDPEPGSPEEMKAQLAQAKAQLQQMQQVIGPLQNELAGKQIEAKSKIDVENIRAEKELVLRLIDERVKLAVAQEMASKAGKEQLTEQAWKELEMASGHAHDLAMQKDQQGHVSEMAEQQAAQQQQMAATQAAPPQ
jgi:hypothetical protein